MKTRYILITALLGSSSALMAQNYLAYTKAKVDMVDSTKSPIKKIEEGDAVFVESEKPEHGLYKVVHLKSKRKGYIAKHDIKIHRELAEHEKTGLTTKNSAVKDPLIEFHNSSRHSMFVKFDDVEFELKPHETHSLKASKGNYYYKVYSSDMEAHYDYARLQEYKKYEWDFYVDEEPIGNLGYSHTSYNK